MLAYTKTTRDETGKVTKKYVMKKDVSRAIQRYARRYGYYTATVRSCTALRLAALKEAGL
jgi:hypothetical protein